MLPVISEAGVIESNRRMQHLSRATVGFTRAQS